uniref:Uncharacterized protein n=1 Tax=Arundo donax TaxID=35708 RepID=A0A0A9DU60_ARUDO
MEECIAYKLLHVWACSKRNMPLHVVKISKSHIKKGCKNFFLLLYNSFNTISNRLFYFLFHCFIISTRGSLKFSQLDPRKSSSGLKAASSLSAAGLQSTPMVLFGSRRGGLASSGTTRFSYVTSASSQPEKKNRRHGHKGLSGLVVLAASTQ